MRFFFVARHEIAAAITFSFILIYHLFVIFFSSVRYSNNIAAIIDYKVFIKLHIFFGVWHTPLEFHTLVIRKPLHWENLYEFKWHPYVRSRKQWRAYTSEMDGNRAIKKQRQQQKYGERLNISINTPSLWCGRCSFLDS